MCVGLPASHRDLPQDQLRHECLLWVETTHQPVAAFEKRTFNVGFPAVSSKSCRSPPDPDLTVAEAKSRRLLSRRTRRSGATLPALADLSDVPPPSLWTERRRLSNVSRGPRQKPGKFCWEQTTGSDPGRSPRVRISNRTGLCRLSTACNIALGYQANFEPRTRLAACRKAGLPSSVEGSTPQIP